MPQSFYEPRQSHHHGDDRLAQLAALAQIYGGINGQANQQGQNQQQNALAVLGLMMQHQHQQDLLGVQKTGQEQNQNQFNVQQTQATNELKMKDLWEQHKLEADKAANDQALTRTGLTNAAGLPGMTPEVYAKLAEVAGVHGFAPFNAANESAIVNRNVSELRPLFGGLYSQFPDHPKQAQQGVNTLWTDPRMQNPKVQEQLQPYLNQLDASLYKPAEGPNFSAADVPPDMLEQFRHANDYQQQNQLAAVALQQKAEADKKRALVQQYLIRNSPDYLPAQY